MKNLFTAFLTFTIALSAIAEVPSLINYQGKLSDEAGNPVNGTKTFSLKIYDAKTGGKEIYKEDIGNIALKNGIYSFGFGEAGQSVVTTTEVLARVDGEKQVFNYITKNKPILGNVTISGPEFSWTDEGGSSDTSEFTATLNKNSGAVSAIYLTKIPSQGSKISISYDHHIDGVMDALLRSDQAWLELTMGDQIFSPRERLVSVPFANYARKAQAVDPAALPEITLINKGSMMIETAPQGWTYVEAPQDITLFESRVLIPDKVTYLKINFAHAVVGRSYGGTDLTNNVNAKMEVVLNNKVIYSRDLNTSWKIINKGTPQSLTQIANVADYLDIKIPIDEYKNNDVIKVQYKYISGGQFEGNLDYKICAGKIIYMIVSAGFN